MKKTEIKIIVKGYVRKGAQGMMRASPNVVLIKNRGLNILVDPGANEKLLRGALSEERLRPEEIDLIFLTHYHLDHLLNIRLFPEKEILDGGNIYREDEIIEYSDEIPNTDIKVIKTPGHTEEHSSLLVETEEGKIVVTGDLFWWFNGEEQKTDLGSLINHFDSYAQNHELLKESRERILKIGDFIIPGHGEMFKIRR